MQCQSLFLTLGSPHNSESGLHPAPRGARGPRGWRQAPAPPRPRWAQAHRPKPALLHRRSVFACLSSTSQQFTVLKSCVMGWVVKGVLLNTCYKEGQDLVEA